MSDEQAKRPMRRIVEVETDDWVKVYLDGEFMGEGHSLRYLLPDLFAALGIREVGVYVNPEVYEENLGNDEFFAKAARDIMAEDVAETGIPLAIDDQA